MASTFAAAVAREAQTRRPLAAILVSRATCPCTVGHHPCPTGTPTMYHWGTAHVLLGHRPCTTGTPTMYHWDTDHVPLGHRPCTTGTPPMSHWDTGHVPLGRRPCPTGTPTMYHWDTGHLPLGHRPCTTATAPMYHWDSDPVPLSPSPLSQRYILGAHVRAHRVTRFFLHVPALPLDKSFQRAYIVRYNVEFRKIFGFGGCRRYRRAG
jgi:hypothetical protein